jgi:hypothetical protein
MGRVPSPDLLRATFPDLLAPSPDRPPARGRETPE